MKIKTLILIFLAYGLVFGSFYTYLKVSQLKEPLFLTHYYQKEITESSADHISIYYISNSGEDWRLVSAESKQFPSRMIFVEDESIHYQEGIYQQHEAILSIKGIEEDELLLEEMTFNFSNGKVVEADIGAIQLSSMESMESMQQVVKITGGGGSNQGESYSSLDVLRESRLTEIKLPYEGVLSPVIKLAVEASDTMAPEAMDIEDFKKGETKESIDDIELPLKLKSDERLSLNALVYKDDMYKNDIHAIEADIVGTFKTDNKEIQQRLVRISEQPYLTSKQIKELKKLREVESKHGEGN
ncbi:hypothetical protein ACOJQI_05390 [Bacillus salacetis]|uniref:hypothetical protein n=1 Tax=Bacillus salacetis TaxID=2315464 RepID=UPI003BA2C003